MAEHKVVKTKSVDPAIDATGKNLLWKFVAQVNKWLNPGHAWTDYGSKNDSMVDSWLRSQSGFSLTNAEQQANEFTASEAQKQRDWEEQMSNTAYQRQVADMRAAGINPALAMSNSSGASTPSGASATSVSPSAPGLSFSDLMQLLMMPVQKKLLQSQAKLAEKQGEAALLNAGANVRNAGTNEKGLGLKEKEVQINGMRVDVEKYRAETDRMRYGLEKARTDKQIEVSDAEINEISAKTALLNLQREQLPEQLAIAKRQVSASERQAAAALRQADAAVQNAATNDRLADYETSLKYAEELLKWSEKEGRDIVNKYLDERQRRELENIVKEGIRLDAQGRLIDKQGRLVSAQMVKTYINCATDISGAINQWCNPMSSGASSGLSIESVNANIGLGGYGSW